tara:strand:- start:10820 stop:11545 length:726 start_codon:yes stop_codon:yes gene_type:complete
MAPLSSIVIIESAITATISHGKKQINYLEIGVDEGLTFDKIKAEYNGIRVEKDGVDPYGEYTNNVHRMTSQVFFALNRQFWKKTYDVVFIDGCHFSPIVDEEIESSLKVLRPGGVIILDDTCPSSEISGRVTEEDIINYNRQVSYPLNQYHTTAVKGMSGFPHVNGDVWKSVAKLRMTRSDLRIFSIPSSNKTFINRGIQESLMPAIAIEDLDWQFYKDNLNTILNPIEFRDIKGHLHAGK